MKFSDFLWQTIAPIYQEIINHPFNRELAEGSLEETRFIFYLEQDAHYLVGFSRALALVAARAASTNLISSFLNFAHDALVAERHLHAHFLGKSGSWDTINPSPACLAYTHFLLASAATAPLEEAIAALLPCFCIYREVGRTIAPHNTETHPYRHWIETYSSQEFSDGTEKAISIFDSLAWQCSTKELECMQKAFEYSSLFEWHFWNDAYHQNIFRDSIKKNISCPLFL